MLYEYLINITNLIEIIMVIIVLWFINYPHSFPY